MPRANMRTRRDCIFISLSVRDLSSAIEVTVVPVMFAIAKAPAPSTDMRSSIVISACASGIAKASAAMERQDVELRFMCNAPLLSKPILNGIGVVGPILSLLSAAGDAKNFQPAQGKCSQPVSAAD